MAEVLTHLCAQSFVLSGTITGTATDQGGAARTITYHSGADTYARTFLAATAGTGTEANPVEFLTAVEAALDNLGNYWQVTLRPSGLVRLTYLGTGTGELTLPASIAYLLGHSSAIGPLATNAYVDGTYHPTHCVFSLAFVDDSGWVRRAPRRALASLPTGAVYGWTDRQPGALRRGTWTLQPYTWAVRAAYNASNPTDPIEGTPLEGYEGAAGTQAADPAQPPPWGCLTQLNNAAAQRLGVAWGNLQPLIAGTGGETFDVCAFTPACLEGATNAPASENWAARWNVSGLEFSLITQGVSR